MEERLLGTESREIGDLKRRVWIESKKIWTVGFPAMLARVSQFGMFVVTQAFIGHIGELQLAAYAIIQTITVRFANGILLGMSSATETMCGQAYGAGQHHMLGIYLQRSFIINLGTATLLLPVFIFSSQLFTLLGEGTQLSEIAGYISLWFIPVLYFFAFVFTIQKFLQSQLKNQIVGWISLAAFVLHIVLSWVFVMKLDLGIPGAMSAMGISCWVVVIGEFLYVCGGWCPNTWKGLSLAAFTDLLPVLKLSISSGIMLCLEFWYTAVLVLIAGYMENATTQVSALSICLNISSWEFMFCLAFLTSASVRISNELGRGDAKAARFSIKVIFCSSLIVGIMFFILCLLFGRQIAGLFTDEDAVVEVVQQLSTPLAFSVLLNSLQSVFSGIAVGAGRQSMVACVNISCYYGVGVPLGVVLGYVLHLQVEGIWIGMIIGVVLQVLVLGYITFTTNWDDQVEKATDRMNRWFLRPSEESNENSTRQRLIG